MSAVFAGGLAPFIATALLARAGEYWTVAVYVMAAGLISFVSVYLATESFREDLTEELTSEPGYAGLGASALLSLFEANRRSLIGRTSRLRCTGDLSGFERRDEDQLARVDIFVIPY
jgi:hypothetical protein